MFNLPKKIYLMRHLLSLGNVDVEKYNEIPDNKIPILNETTEQNDYQNLLIKSTGIVTILEDRYKSDRLEVKNTSYLRTMQTTDKLFQLTNIQITNTSSQNDTLLREIECKENLTYLSEEDRLKLVNSKKEFGNFFHRWTSGESEAMHYERCLTWWNSFRLDSVDKKDPADLFLITHKGTITNLLAILRTHRSTGTYYSNINNGSVIELTLHESCNRYEITNVFVPDLIIENLLLKTYIKK